MMTDDYTEAQSAYESTFEGQAYEILNKGGLAKKKKKD